jgi:uncharacterized protein (TIGR03437 family)
LALTSIAGKAQAQGTVTVITAATPLAGVFPVAPGSIAAAYGSFNGADAFAVAGSTPLPTTLGNARVFVNNVAAPLFFVSPLQINFQVPLASPVGIGPLSVRVTVNGADVATGSLNTLQTAPGIFTLDAAAVAKPGAVVNSNGTVNGPTNPATRGDFVLIFGTGQGPVDIAITDGTPPSGLATATSSTRVLFGAVDGNVLFSGLAPGFVGLWQMNVVIPEQPFVKGAVPVVAIVNGISSGAVTILVAE